MNESNTPLEELHILAIPEGAVALVLYEDGTAKTFAGELEVDEETGLLKSTAIIRAYTCLALIVNSHQDMWTTLMPEGRALYESGGNIPPEDSPRH